MAPPKKPRKSTRAKRQILPDKKMSPDELIPILGKVSLEKEKDVVKFFNEIIDRADDETILNAIDQITKIEPPPKGATQFLDGLKLLVKNPDIALPIEPNINFIPQAKSLRSTPRKTWMTSVKYIMTN